MYVAQPTLPGYEWAQTDPREWALANGYTFEWRDDWSVGSHVEEYPDAYDAEPHECEWVEMLSASGESMAAIGCVDDADDAYRRDIESDLAAEIMP